MTLHTALDELDAALAAREQERGEHMGAVRAATMMRVIEAAEAVSSARKAAYERACAQPDKSGS